MLPVSDSSKSARSCGQDVSQFADVREIVATIAALPGAHGIALAAERARRQRSARLGCRGNRVGGFRHRRAQPGQRQPLRESAIANVKRLCELRDASAHRPVVNAAISMALGCSITGDVDPTK